MKKILIMFMLAFLVGTSVHANITATIGTVTAVPGTMVSIPVTLTGANGLSSVTAGDLYFGYDVTKLSATSAFFSNYSTIAPSNDWIGNPHYDSTAGIMMNGYMHPMLMSASFPDNTVIFHLNFMYVGPTATAITWLTSGVTTSFLADEMLNIIPMTFVNGGVNPQLPTPAIPTLSLPANLATGVSVNPNLQWNTAANAQEYQVQVSTNNSFTTTVVDQTVTGTSYSATGLVHNTQYFWRVKSIAGTNSSDWSTVWSFTTEDLPATGIIATIGTVSATPGTMVTIPITLSGANGLNSVTAGDLYFGYDITKVSATNATFSDYSAIAPSNDWIGNTHYDTLAGIMMNGYMHPMLMSASFPNNTVIFKINVFYTGPTATDITWLTSGITTSFLADEMLNIIPMTFVNGGITPITVTPDVPTLSLPANMATNVSVNPSLEWNAALNATSYVVQVSTSNTFATTVYNENVTGTSFNAVGLANNTEYFWKVKAVNAGAESAWSSVWSFTTTSVPLDIPTLITPIANATEVELDPTFSWNAVNTATGYTLQVSESNTFATFVYNQDVTGTSQQVTGLNGGTTYFWKVRALRGTETGDFSTVREFTTLIPLLPPALATPANGSGNVSLNPTLTWNAANMVDNYTIQVSTSADFTSFIFNGPVVGTSKSLTGLLNGTQYFWRAKSHRGTDVSEWSPVWSFYTVAVVPPPSQARFLSFSGVTTSAMNLAWINGNGDGRLVLAATENMTSAQWTDVINALNADVTAYNATNGTWANKIPVTAGGKTAYVVGKATGTTRMLNLTGLNGATMYYFHIVEHKYTPALYNSFGAILNPRSKNTLQGVNTPVATPATEVSSDMFFANWTLGSTEVDFFEVELNGVIYDVGAAASANGFHFPFLTNANTSYTYKVRTVFNGTRSPWSNEITVVTYPVGILVGPTSVCANADFPNQYSLNLTGVTVTWSAPYSFDDYETGDLYMVTWNVPGDYEVIANITDASGNTGTQILMVTVTALPVVTCPAPIEVCANDGPIDLTTLTGYSPMGGIFMGDGIINNVFYPNDGAIVVGTPVTVYYHYQDPNTDCVNYCSFTITVKAVPQVTAPNDIVLCADAAPVTLAGGMPVGGTYMIGETVITAFDPANYAAGIYTVKYVVTGTNACTNYATFTITVNALPVIVTPGPMEVCDATAPFEMTATPVGGTYTGVGVAGNMFDASLAGLGAHTITYVYTDANGCTNSGEFVITVTTSPVVTVPNDMVVCLDAPSFALTGATPTGGVYSGAGVSAGMFNPAAAGAEVHVITYTYTAGTCVVSETFNITVNALPVITVPTMAPVCILDATFPLTGAAPAGGTYTGIGVTNNSFNPSAAGVGTHLITYTYTDANGCTNSATFNLVVAPQISITTHPVDVAELEGSNVSFTVVAQNATGYQWEVMPVFGTWTPIQDETNATLNITNIQSFMNGNRYRVVVSGCGTLTSNFATLTVTTPLVTPTTQAVNITWLNWGRNEISFNWTNGTGTNRIVVAVEGNTWTGWTPTDNVAYTANNNFAMSAPLGAQGARVVYNGNASALTVTGLTRNTNYTFHVFEYNGQAGAYMYNTTGNVSANNPRSRATSRKDGIFTNETRAEDASFSIVGNVTPNPANVDINFNIEVYESSSFRLELVNVLGEAVHAENLYLSEGSHFISLPVNGQTGGLASGTYMIRLVSNGVAVSRNVVVIR